MRKITLATFKKFIRDNIDNLYISQISRFDGMTDCVESIQDKRFYKVEKVDMTKPNTLGIGGLWLVLSGRDYFTEYENESMMGIRLDNCCGANIITTLKK
jgi:hypothetical protein